MDKRIVFLAFLGNALEFYDDCLFGALSFLLVLLFFPFSDPLTSLLIFKTRFNFSILIDLPKVADERSPDGANLKCA